MNLDNYRFPASDGMTQIPFLAFNLTKPLEGFPPKVQWDRWSQSIWHNFERTREPFEIYGLGLEPGQVLEPMSVLLTKGYTRMSIIAFAIIQTLLVEDQTQLSEHERDFFTSFPDSDLG